LTSIDRYVNKLDIRKPLPFHSSDIVFWENERKAEALHFISIDRYGLVGMVIG